MTRVIAMLGMMMAALSSSPGAQSPEDAPARQPPRAQIEPLIRFGAQKDAYRDLFSPRVEIRVQPAQGVHELAKGSALDIRQSAAASSTVSLGALRAPDRYADSQRVQNSRLGPHNGLKRRVICGMVVVDVDPSVDPGIRAPKRAEQDLTYTMRVEQPPICTGE